MTNTILEQLLLDPRPAIVALMLMAALGALAIAAHLYENRRPRRRTRRARR